MIEFNGYLSGETEKYFYKKTAKYGRNIILISLALFLPGTIAFGVLGGFEILLQLYCAIATLMILMTILPKNKKSRLKYTPKRIYTDGVAITCISDKYVETKFIEDAKVVYDKGEFYDIIFPIGNYSEKFVCQKNLLISGTLEEFEKMFGDRLIK